MNGPFTRMLATGGLAATVALVAGTAVGLAQSKSLPAWGAEVVKSPDKTTAGSKNAGAKTTGKPVAAPQAKDKPAADAAATKAKPIETGAIPPAGPIKSEPFADWVRECRTIQTKSVCALRQTVRDGKKRRIVEFIAARSAKTAFLEIRLPLGVSIPFGVSLDLAETVKLPTQLVDCNAAGCRSVIALDDKTLAQLKTAKSLGVSFQDSKSGKVISIGGSIKGFNDAIAKGIGAT